MPNFEKNIRGAIEEADVNRDKKIDESEKMAVEENIRITEKLYNFSVGDKMQVNVLEFAIESVASEYEGLHSDEIRQWIMDAKAQKSDMASRRLGKPPKLREAWKRLDKKQRREMLRKLLKKGLEKVKLNPAQKRRMQQLQIIIDMLEASRDMFGKARHMIDKFRIWRSLGVKERIKYRSYVSNFLRKKVPQIEGDRKSVV